MSGEGVLSNDPQPAPQPGWRFDVFADAKAGKSLFQMDAADWMERVDGDPRYFEDHKGQLNCRHGVILYGTKCVQCDRQQ